MTSILPRYALATRPWLTYSLRSASRCFSSSPVRRSGQFTVVVPSTASQKSVLDAIRRRRDALSPPQRTTTPDNAAVVLATPALAAWLEDDAFVSHLLGLLPVAAAAGDDDKSVSVLGAVVDGLAAPRRRRGSSPSPVLPPVPGLAVLYGDRDVLLPGLWDGHMTKHTTRPDDIEAAVTVRMPPFLPFVEGAGGGAGGTGGTAPLDVDVTLPLAHTVFCNGRRSTLLASRWAASTASTADDEHPFQRKHTESRAHQRIVPPWLASSSSSSSSKITAPLLPLAPPRTIAASLGNIVRQVRDGGGGGVGGGGGAPVPASRELEAVIPALLAARRAANTNTNNNNNAPETETETETGPLGVWALVVPEAAAGSYAAAAAAAPAAAAPAAAAADGGTTTTTTNPLQPPPADAAGHAPDVEQQAAARASAQFTGLLAAGCRLHRILSGGGGWGRKQGLLSLDPQMSHPAAAPASVEGNADDDDDDDDEAMRSFIRSFQGGAADGSSTGQGVDAVAVPGAQVQFFVAPQGAPLPAPGTPLPSPSSSSTSSTPSLVLGSASVTTTTTTTTLPDHVLLLPNHFGAVAEQGLFVATAGVRTKLDVPDAYVHSGE